jgi:CheY-like chemotaxis protein
MGTILIVDDNLDAARPLAKLLKHGGHQGVVLGSGEAALNHLRAAEPLPDLMLLDVMMPGMDGLEVLRHVRGEARTARLPIVLFSAVSDPQFREHAIAKGANDFWVKASIDYDQLQKRINALVPPQTTPPTTPLPPPTVA